MSDNSPNHSPQSKRRAFRPLEFEAAAANLLSLSTLAGVWYYGSKYTNLECIGCLQQGSLWAS